MRSGKLDKDKTNQGGTEWNGFFGMDESIPYRVRGTYRISLQGTDLDLPHFFRSF